MFGGEARRNFFSLVGHEEIHNPRVKFNSTPYQSPRGLADRVHGFATAQATQANFEQNSVICQWRADQLFTEPERPRQIIDLRDTDKSRYFAISELNNCFINRSPSLFSYFNHSVTAQASDLPFFTRER